VRRNVGALIGWGLLPVVLLVLVGLMLSNTNLLDVLRPVPPVEELTYDRVVLAPGEIIVHVVNGGPDPVTIAQVTVDDAFWNFTVAPSSTVRRLGRATVRIPYPWVAEEAHEISILTSTGVTFAHEIPVAMETPPPGLLFFGVFAAIGLYVGVIPVAIGLLWLPFLRRLDPKWIRFSLALTAGLLLFLGLDAGQEALEAASEVAGSYQGTAVVVIGVLGTLLLLQSMSRRRLSAGGEEGRRAVAGLVALGIGFHNLGEGLAIGAAYALGEAALGTALVVGFMMHNTTEGLAIVAPIAKDEVKLGFLARLGFVAGAPTVLGAWLGGLAYSPFWAALFLSIGIGAIVQVILAVYRMIAKPGEEIWTPLTATGLMTGLLIMYGTGLFVAT
jgi:zinc transporter ZupT